MKPNSFCVRVKKDNQYIFWSRPTTIDFALRIYSIKLFENFGYGISSDVGQYLQDKLFIANHPATRDNWRAYTHYLQTWWSTFSDKNINNIAQRMNGDMIELLFYCSQIHCDDIKDNTHVEMIHSSRT